VHDEVHEVKAAPPHDVQVAAAKLAAPALVGVKDVR